MSEAEIKILRQFLTFRMKAEQMLFFPSGYTKPNPQSFARAVQSLIERRFLVQERRKDSYSLTADGYAAASAL